MPASIIIPAWNQWADTRRCLESIARHTPDPYEVIVVDNGSTDGTPDFIASEYPYVRLVRNPVNLGFPRAANQGLALAAGDPLVLLNNDVVVTPRWLAGLTRCLREAPGAGLVGPVSNYVSGAQQIAVAYRTTEEMEMFADRFNRSDPDRWRPVVRLVGFCLAISRRLYEALGPLDEAFGPGNYEDDDYCLRALAAGYRLWIAGDIFVHHGGSTTFRRDPAAFVRLLNRNREILRRKHGLERYRVDPYPHLAAWLPGHLRRVLDVGCGLGAAGLQLKQAGVGEVWGVTWDPAEARIARQVLDRMVLVEAQGFKAAAPLAHCEAFETLAAAGPFDGAVVSGGLDDAAEPARLLGQVRRLLAPGAPLVIQPLNRHHFLAPGIREHLASDLPVAEEDRDSRPATRFRLDQVAELVESLGLSDVESAALLWPPPDGLAEQARQMGRGLVPGGDAEMGYRLLSTWRFLVRGRTPAGG